MHFCMAGAVRTPLSVLSVFVHVCARLLCCSCLYLLSVLSFLAFMFCVGVFLWVADFNLFLNHYVRVDTCVGIMMEL